MLRDGHQRGVQDGALGSAGQLSRDEQPDVVREADVPDELGTQIPAADQDDLLVGGGDGRGVMSLRTDLHDAAPIMARDSLVTLASSRTDLLMTQASGCGSLSHTEK
jgi:hypothetical protein